MHFSADPDTVDTIYRIIFSVNQLSVYGAVAAVYDEFEGPSKIERDNLWYWWDSQLFLEKFNAEVLVNDEDPRDQIILQQYVQQVESLSPEKQIK